MAVKQLASILPGALDESDRSVSINAPPRAARQSTACDKLISEIKLAVWLLLLLLLTHVQGGVSACRSACAILYAHQSAERSSRSHIHLLCGILRPVSTEWSANALPVLRTG